MLKKFVTLMLVALLGVLGFSENLHAKSKKSKSEISRSTKKKSKGKYKSRSKRSKKYKRSGNWPDLRALTTETPNTEYTEIPDNGGVNSVEKKRGYKMKRLLLAAFIALPMSAFANVISFQCVSTDLPGVHKFDASGTISVDDLNKVEGVLTIHTQKAQSVQSVQTFEEVRVTGFIRHFKDGELTKKAFDQLVINKTNEPYIKSLNLLLDFKTKIASRANSVDNFSYRSNCKVTERLAE